jgi:hypothetical protein
MWSPSSFRRTTTQKRVISALQRRKIGLFRRVSDRKSRTNGTYATQSHRTNNSTYATLSLSKGRSSLLYASHRMNNSTYATLSLSKGQSLPLCAYPLSNCEICVIYGEMPGHSKIVTSGAWRSRRAGLLSHHQPSLEARTLLTEDVARSSGDAPKRI